MKRLIAMLFCSAVLFAAGSVTAFAETPVYKAGSRQAEEGRQARYLHRPRDT